MEINENLLFLKPQFTFILYEIHILKNIFYKDGTNCYCIECD